jgi:guanylate cyclase
MRKKLSLKAHSSQLGLAKITAETLLQMFPFGLLIDKNMKIVGAGEKMMEAWLEAHAEDDVPQMLGHDVTDYFKLRRPSGMRFDFKSVKEVRICC